MRFLILVALGLVAPAMAAVTISVVPVEWEGAVDIVVEADGPDVDANYDSLVAGIALDVSVDAGNIVAVTGYKAPGVSTPAGRGYGVYLGTIGFEVDGEGNPISINAGTPVAPFDNPGSVHTSAFPATAQPAITLEFACLFDTSDLRHAGAPFFITTLCRLTVSRAATVHLVENATRAGVVMIGGGRPSELILNDGTVEGCCGIPGLVCCYFGPDMDEWCSVGMPISWCRKYQCRGDMNGTIDVIGTLPFPPYEAYGPVGAADLGLFLAAYKVENGDASENLAADLNHSEDVIGMLPFPPYEAYGRTGSADLTIFLANYKVETAGVSDCGWPPLP